MFLITRKLVHNVNVINLIICIMIELSLLALCQVELYSGRGYTCYESNKPLLTTYQGLEPISEF